jgi:hypothetical protein
VFDARVCSCLSDCLSIHPSIHPSNCLAVRRLTPPGLYVYSSIHLYVYHITACVQLSVFCRPVCPLICLSFRWSVCRTHGLSIWRSPPPPQKKTILLVPDFVCSCWPWLYRQSLLSLPAFCVLVGFCCWELYVSCTDRRTHPAHLLSAILLMAVYYAPSVLLCF